jgi:hypothetical protein
MLLPRSRCELLGCYAASGDNLGQAWILEPWRWDRQVVPNQHYSLRNSPEGRSSLFSPQGAMNTLLATQPQPCYAFNVTRAKNNRGDLELFEVLSVGILRPTVFVKCHCGRYFAGRRNKHHNKWYVHLTA